MTNLNIQEIKRKFFYFFKKENFIKRNPIPLVSDYFPSSFTISAGPDLGTEYYNLAKNKKNFMLLQPCARYWDIKDSGDGRHLSMFEMSAINDFGYNGRKRIIELYLKFFSEELKINKKNLCATYFKGGIVHKKNIEKDKEFLKIMNELDPTISLYTVGKDEGFVANAMEPFGGEKVEFYHINKNKKCEKKCGGTPNTCHCGKFLEIATSIKYSYIVNASKDKKILKIKKIDLENKDNINVIGFGLERIVSILGEEHYSLEKIDLFKNILNNKKFNLKKENFKIVDYLRALTFLISSMKNYLRGKNNKERRWVFNKYRNKELLLFVKNNKKISKLIIEEIINYHKHDNYLFKNSEDILDTIINWEKFHT